MVPEDRQSMTVHGSTAACNIMCLNLNLIALQHVPIHTSLDERPKLGLKHLPSCFHFRQYLAVSKPFLSIISRYLQSRLPTEIPLIFIKNYHIVLKFMIQVKQIQHNTTKINYLTEDNRRKNKSP